MPTFITQRVSRQHNVLFPDKITIEGSNITYYKGEIIGYKSIVILRENIASIAINENILFADVVIESKGGQKIAASGFTKTDAREIMNLLM
jgi:hypothetical protein